MSKREIQRDNFLSVKYTYKPYLNFKAGLNEQGVADCVSDKMAKGAEKYAHCEGAYTEDESAILMDVFTKIAEYKCFTGQFKEACATFIESEYVQPLIMSLYA